MPVICDDPWQRAMTGWPNGQNGHSGTGAALQKELESDTKEEGNEDVVKV